MTTKAEIFTYAREQTLLDTTDVSDAVLSPILDRATTIVGSRFPWPFLEASATFDTVVDQVAYTVPTGCKYITDITREDTKVRLRELTPNSARQRYGDDPPTGSARAFYMWAGDIVLVEVPTAIETYNVFYTKGVTLMDATSESPEWAEQHHLFLGDYVVARLWDREEDLRAAAAADARFEEGLGLMAQFYLHQASDTPIVWGESPDRIVGGNIGNMPWLDGA